MKTPCPSVLGQLELALSPLLTIFLIFNFGVCYNLQKVGKYLDRPKLSNTVTTGHISSAQKPQVMGWHRTFGCGPIIPGSSVGHFWSRCSGHPSIRRGFFWAPCSLHRTEGGHLPQGKATTPCSKLPSLWRGRNQSSRLIASCSVSATPAY